MSMLRVSFRAFRPVLLFPVALLAGLPALAMAADGRPPALTPWAMYQQADWVVKAVMLGLLLASLLTWAALVAKSIELRRVGTRLRALAGRFEATGSLAELAGEQDGAGALRGGAGRPRGAERTPGLALRPPRGRAGAADGP
jgi:hypothetical protein